MMVVPHQVTKISRSEAVVIEKVQYRKERETKKRTKKYMKTQLVRYKKKQQIDREINTDKTPLIAKPPQIQQVINTITGSKHIRNGETEYKHTTKTIRISSGR